jgi:choline dehydrogenase
VDAHLVEQARPEPQLNVHGITNLRIADASVMPSINSGNTNAAALAIAEAAASLITGEHIKPATELQAAR